MGVLANTKPTGGVIANTNPANWGSLVTQQTSRPLQFATPRQNPATINNTKDLQSALKTGAITKDEFAQRLEKLTNSPTKAGSKYTVGNIAGSLKDAVNNVLIKPAVNTAKIIPNTVSYGAAQATHNQPAIQKSGNALQSSAGGSLISPLANVATMLGTNLAANKLLSSKLTSPEVKQAQLREAINPEYNKTGFDINDSKNKTRLKGALLVAEAAATPILNKGLISGPGVALKSLATRNGAAANIIKTLKGTDTKFSNHVYSTLEHHLNTLEEAKKTSGAKTAVGMSRLNEAETIAKTPPPKQTKLIAPPTGQKLLTAPKPSTQKLITGSKQNFTMPVKDIAMESQRVVGGTEKLSKEYLEEVKTLNKNVHPTTSVYQEELNKLDDKYIKLHSDLIDGVGRFAPQVGKSTKLSTKVKSPKASPLVTAMSRAKSKPVPKTAPVKQIMKVQEKTVEPTTVKIETTTTKPTETSQVTTKSNSSTTNSKRGTSKVALSIQQKAVERGLKDTFGEAGGYDKITIKNQAEKAVALTNDRSALEKVISGEKPLPNGLRATALIKAVEEHPVLNKDHDLINRLSAAEHLTGESSRSAQELRLARERNPNSVVDHLKQIREFRISNKNKQLKNTTVDKELIKTSKEIKTNTPKITKESWSSFIESIKC